MLYVHITEDYHSVCLQCHVVVTRGPNFATFHFRHVSDEEEEGEGGNTTTTSFPFRHVSDDEETKKNTPR